ncbi:DUF397 domain-containing protein [Actinomadura sp. WMMA1423]|uniref:DUF397 domain-containing protein n=1 Tax=Actinomadura sp. WMMA1423 TaxID=2591108 RepID=UPI00114641CB|nr:DUF397 domain-containing protein [Actinomadura sp. WMMA1423]
MNRELVWRKSSRSGSSGGNCVELAGLAAGVAIRDSKDPNGPALLVRPSVLREAIRLAAE